MLTSAFAQLEHRRERSPSRPLSDDRIGSTLGNIRILRSLGEGGMGQVYLGYDEKLDREVAVKAIREGLADSESRARFLREARALSQLDHPNICRIHEYLVGDHEDFLVLELVTGQGLRAARERLSYPVKLAVAEQIADALAAAHAKGIIHRDLKPDNVMITPEGGVKVLDFGLARSGEHHQVGLEEGSDGDEVTQVLARPGPLSPPEDRGDGTAAHFRTRFGNVIGTVTCMSPEQAKGGLVTTASDLYSLGLLLQLLFTGRPAFDPGLDRRALALKVVAGETVPVTGLDRDLTRLLEDLKSAAPANRPTALDTVRRLRLLRSKPRQRQWRLAAAAAVLIVLGAAAKYTFDLRRERNLAVAARKQAEQARAEAEVTTNFVVELFKVSDPGEARGNTITARELLDRGAKALPEKLLEQPLVQARLMATIGRIYFQLGLYEQAEPRLRQALTRRERLLGPEHADVAASLTELATLYQGQGRPAEPLFLRALAIREKALGRNHPDVAVTLNNLAVLYAARGEFVRARPLFERALAIRRSALGPSHPEVAKTLNNLGSIARQLGNDAEGERLLLEGLRIREAVLAPDHPDLAANLEALGVLYIERRPREAESLLRRAAGIWERAVGRETPQVARCLANLATVLTQEGKLEEAEELERRALALKEKLLGPAHPSCGHSWLDLAKIYRKKDRLHEADGAYRQALQIWRASLSPDHPNLREALLGHAELLRVTGRTGEAAVLERQAGPAPTRGS